MGTRPGAPTKEEAPHATVVRPGWPSTNPATTPAYGKRFSPEWKEDFKGSISAARLRLAQHLCPAASQSKATGESPRRFTHKRPF